MKGLFLLIGLIAAVAAHAETITLGTDACSVTRQCLEVPNDAALDINIYASPSLPYVSLNVDGVAYSSKTGNGQVLDNVMLTDSVGNIVYLSGTFSSYKTCTRSGRGQTCSTHWSFLGGSLSY